MTQHFAGRLIGRESELERLQRSYDRPDGQLVLVWGRRRIGKSYLLEAFSRGKPTVFYQAKQQAEPVELDAFTKTVAPAVGGEYLSPDYRFPNWEAALDFPTERNRHPRLLVVLDEFPYLAESTPGLESIIQRWWDRRGRNSSVMLVLCGSAQTFMESLEAEAAPLHQRFTARVHIGPLSYRDAAKFAPSLDHADHARIYGILGGTPLYLEKWDEDESLEQNLLQLFGEPSSMLVDSAELVLTSDVPETKAMFRMLQAIGLGKTRFSEIRDWAKVTSERPLQRLIQVQLIERRVPANEDPERSKRSMYCIRDPYFRFFFRFISRNRGEIDRGLGAQVIREQVLPYFDQYMGYIFEDIARSYVMNGAANGRWNVDRIGQWWSSDGQHEIDIVGTRNVSDVVLAGSVKWRSDALDKRVLDDLEADIRAIGGSEKVHRILVGRGGVDLSLARGWNLTALSN